jgi:hypothetical protein
MIFDQLPRTIGKIDVSNVDIRHLPQFYRADMDMVWRLGGRLYRDVLGQLGFASKWKYISVDSRTSMLMPGMFPCIPGWHCDDFYRPSGHTDLRSLMEQAPSEHAMLLVGDCSRTVFLNEAIEWNPPDYGGVHAHAHRFIEKQIEKADVYKRPRRVLVEPGSLTWFGPLSWHKGTAATKQGWRHFLRITGSHHYEPQNELRTQTQVYLLDEGAGW